MANPVGRPRKKRDEMEVKNPVGRPKVSNEIWVQLSTRINLDVEENLVAYLTKNKQEKKAHVIDRAITEYLDVHEKDKVKKNQEKDQTIKMIMPLSCRIKSETNKRLRPYIYKTEEIKSHIVNQAISEYIDKMENKE